MVRVMWSSDVADGRTASGLVQCSPQSCSCAAYQAHARDCRAAGGGELRWRKWRVCGHTEKGGPFWSRVSGTIWRAASRAAVLTLHAASKSARSAEMSTVRRAWTVWGEAGSAALRSGEPFPPLWLSSPVKLRRVGSSIESGERGTGPSDSVATPS